MHKRKRERAQSIAVPSEDRDRRERRKPAERAEEPDVGHAHDEVALLGHDGGAEQALVERVHERHRERPRGFHG